MSRLRWLTLFPAVLAIAGCTAGGTKVNSLPSLSPTSASPSPSAQPTASTPATAPPSLSATVFALANPGVGFTGDPVAVVVQTLSPEPVALLISGVDFGDGVVVSEPVTGCRMLRVTSPNEVTSPAVVHRYATPGQHTIHVWSALGCAGNQSIQYSSTTVFQFPSAPPGAWSWPRCQPDELTATTTEQGAAGGNVGTMVVLRNRSAQSCHLFGYPGAQLLGAHDASLHTTVTWGGSYLFPMVAPHLVGLGPGQSASFDLAYGDNPVGDPPPPYDQACPTATGLAVIPPDDTAAVHATASLAPCSGAMDVSSVLPGTTWIPFE